jgi:hypothetical protein
MTPNILIGIVEVLKSYDIKLDSDLISEIVDVFVTNGMSLDDLEECYGFDNELDLVLDEYERASDDEDDDEWVDGGREDF